MLRYLPPTPISPNFISSSINVLPFAWTLLPASWSAMCFDVKLCALSPDDTRPGETRKKVMENEGEYKVRNRAKPLSHSKVGPSNQSTAATLDAVWTLLANPGLNPGGVVTIDSVENIRGLCLPSDHYLLQDPKDKPLDIPGFLIRVQDQPKAIYPKRLTPHSFQVRFGGRVSPAGWYLASVVGEVDSSSNEGSVTPSKQNLVHSFSVALQKWTPLTHIS